MLHILKCTLKVFSLVLLFIYLVILAHIPFAHFTVAPHFIMGLWLACVALLFVMAVWTVYDGSPAKFGALTALALAIHVSVFTIPDVYTAFDIDRCLDRGGHWKDAACDLPEMTLQQ